MCDGSGSSLSDYKFFCFNGKPSIIALVCDRYTELSINYYDLEWNLLPWRRKYKNTDRNIPKPRRLDKMLEIAQILSEGLIFARIDLFDVQGKIIFGEVTIYPESGFAKFHPESVDLALGDKMDIRGLLGRVKKK